MLNFFLIFNSKVNIFWEGNKILQNLLRRFDRYYIGQIYNGDFANILYSLLGNGTILLPKLFWPTVRKNCASDREKLLKIEAEGREFAKFWDHLNNLFKQRTIFGNRMHF